MPSQQCTKCNKATAGVSYDCDSCKRCFCMSCSELTPDEVRCMTLRKRKLLYLCTQCEGGLRLVPRLIQQIEELRNSLEEVKATVKANASENFSAQAICNEVEERNTLRRNVMVTGVQESKKSGRNDRVSDDKQAVKTILTQVDGVELSALEDIRVYRVGKFVRGENRMIKAVLKTADLALEILKGKRAIDIPGVKIFADQTKMQRDYYKSMRVKVSELNAQGQDDNELRYINGVPKIVKKRDNMAGN